MVILAAFFGVSESRTQSSFARGIGFRRFLFGSANLQLNIGMKNTKLQAADRWMLERYGAWATHMLTLTYMESKSGAHVIKDGWAKGAVNYYDYDLTENAAENSLRYFIKALNYRCYGRKSRKQRTKNVCQILALPVIEGAKGNKRMHAHILLGNIPADLGDSLENVAREVWASTKWGMHRLQLDEIHHIDGAAYYVGKEVGYINDGAVRWEHASVPGRLLGKWS